MRTRSPETVRGTLHSYDGARFYCRTCADMQRVIKVISVAQKVASYASEVILECGHKRDIVITVMRTVTDKRKYDAETGEELESPESKESREIRLAMAESGVPVND